MVRRSGPASADRDLAAAKDIIAADAVVDRQKDAVRAATVEALARHAPVASDLRLILAVEHIAGNLQRAADHAKNIAKRTLSLTSAHRLDPATRDLMARLHRAVTAMFEDSLKAFERGDAELAAQVRGRDSEPDALYDDLFPRGDRQVADRQIRSGRRRAGALCRQKPGTHRRSRHQHRRRGAVFRPRRYRAGDPAVLIAGYDRSASLSVPPYSTGPVGCPVGEPPRGSRLMRSCSPFIGMS